MSKNIIVVLGYYETFKINAYYSTRIANNSNDGFLVTFSVIIV